MFWIASRAWVKNVGVKSSIWVTNHNVSCAKRLLHPGLRRSNVRTVVSVRCPSGVRPRFRWFLRRVQVCVIGSYPPRQFFRNLPTVYFSNPHKQRLANDGSIFWDPFLDHLFEQKSEHFTKKYPNILMQKMIENALFASPALQGVI